MICRIQTPRPPDRRRHSRRNGGSHGLLRSRLVHPQGHHRRARGPALVRPGPQLALRLQPRRGDRVLPEGVGARPRLCHGLLGDLLRGRAELQPALAPLRPGRQGDRARRRARRNAERPGPCRRRQPGRAGADPRPARTLSAARDHRGPVAVGRRLCGRHAPGVPRPPPRPRGALRLRRGDPEPDALEDVGPQDRGRRRGRRHGGGGRRAGERLPRHPRLVGAIRGSCISTST